MEKRRIFFAAIALQGSWIAPALAADTTPVCMNSGREYKIGGSVQHGASTLPESVFNKFPESDAVEIHLATGFQNMILDAPSLPRAMKDAIRDFCFVNCQDERKSGDTDEQFVYKTRKKALGPFKQQLWELPPEHKQPIIGAGLQTAT